MKTRILFSCLFIFSAFFSLAQTSTKIFPKYQLKEAPDSNYIFLTDEEGRPIYQEVAEQISADSFNVLEAGSDGLLRVQASKCFSQTNLDLTGDRIVITENNGEIPEDPTLIDVYKNGQKLIYLQDYNITDLNGQGLVNLNYSVTSEDFVVDFCTQISSVGLSQGGATQTLQDVVDAEIVSDGNDAVVKMENKTIVLEGRALGGVTVDTLLRLKGGNGTGRNGAYIEIEADGNFFFPDSKLSIGTDNVSSFIKSEGGGAVLVMQSDNSVQIEGDEILLHSNTGNYKIVEIPSVTNSTSDDILVRNANNGSLEIKKVTALVENSHPNVTVSSSNGKIQVGLNIIEAVDNAAVFSAHGAGVLWYPSGTPSDVRVSFDPNAGGN